STNFPTANPLQLAYGGGSSDAFVTKLSAAGNALVYSTYLGGHGPLFGGFGETGSGIAVDLAGHAYVTGATRSTNFPTAYPLQGFLFGGSPDAFVAKLNAFGSALVFSTYLGGSDGDDFGNSIAVDALGNIYVTGQTFSRNFPIVGAVQVANAGGGDAF